MNPTIQILHEQLASFREKKEKVKNLRIALKELPKVEEEMEVLSREIIKTLDSCDLLARGNYGWEGRVIHFLESLTREPEKT